MPRLISVTLTEAAVIARTKTVTRRLGWRFLTPGDRLTLCRKVMGRRRPDGTVEPLVRLAEVQVIHVRREPLDAISGEDVGREGFPQWSTAPQRFVDFFITHMGCQSDTMVTRIEWRYLTDPDSRPERRPQAATARWSFGTNPFDRARSNTAGNIAAPRGRRAADRRVR